MEECESIQRQLEKARRLLDTLEEQAAGYTSLTIPAHLKLQLEEQREKVARLEARLAVLLSEPPPLAQPSRPDHRIMELMRSFFRGRAVAGEKAAKGQQEEEASVRNYLEVLINNCRFLPPLPTRPSRPGPLQLEDVYVPPVVQSEGYGYAGDVSPTGGSEATLGLLLSPERREYPVSPQAEEEKGPFTISINEAFAECPCLVILGNPGSGKSTFLKYLTIVFARAWLEQNPRILQERLEGFDEILLPVHIPIKAFIQHLATEPHPLPAPTAEELLDFMIHYLSDQHMPLPRRLLERYLSDGKCLFLLDGLDEGGVIDYRIYAAEAILAFRNAYPANRFVVTSRIGGWQGIGGPFRVCIIRPFGRREIEQFIDNWNLALVRSKYGGFPPQAEREVREKSAYLFPQIWANPRIEALATNPLFLTAIAIVYEIKAGILPRRVDLYRECVDLLIGPRDIAKILGGRPGIPSEQIRVDEVGERIKALEKLGLWFQEHEEYRYIDRPRLERVLREMYLQMGFDARYAQESVNKLIQFFQERGGIFEERQPDRFCFSLRAFQEYFAARAIVSEHDPNPAEYFQGKIQSSSWREVICLAAGLLASLSAKGAARFVRTLLENMEALDEEKQEVDRLTCNSLLLAGECLAETGEVLDRDLLRRVSEGLKEAFNSTGIDRLRLKIAKVLAMLPGSSPTSVFEAWLHSASEKDKVAALYGIRYLPGEYLSLQLLHEIFNLAVRERGRRERQDIALSQADRTASREIEGLAVAGLARILTMPGEIGRQLLDWLIEQMTCGSSVQQQVAVEVLARAERSYQHQEKIVSTLQRALKHSRDRVVRCFCIRGLAAYGVGRGVPLSLGELFRLLNDDDWMIRAEAARTAAMLDRDEVPEKLLTRLLHLALRDKDNEREVLCAAARTLEILAPPQFYRQNREKILLALRDEQEEVRAAAARVLGRLGGQFFDEQVGEALIQTMLHDPSDQVGYAAAKALGRIGPVAIGDDIETLNFLLSVAIRREHVDDYGESRLGTYTRSALCHALAHIGKHLSPSRIADALARWVLLGDDPIPEARQGAALALEELGIQAIHDPSLLYGLKETVKDWHREPDSSVRATLLRVLAQEMPSDGKEFLGMVCLMAREDPAKEVRQTAVSVLSRLYSSLGNDLARQELLRVIHDDPDPSVRDAAYGALVQLGESFYPERPIEILDQEKARRARIRVNLERLLIEDKTRGTTGVLRPAEARGVIEDIIAFLKGNFSLLARDAGLPPEECIEWVQATDYGLTRLKLEVAFEDAVRRHVSSREEARLEAALGLCCQLLEEAIFRDFYVRPKASGLTLRKREDWQRLREELQEFCFRMRKPDRVYEDWEIAGQHLNSARFLVRRMCDPFYDLPRPPLSFQEPPCPEDFRGKLSLLCQKIDKGDTNPFELRVLVDAIWTTPTWE